MKLLFLNFFNFNFNFFNFYKHQWAAIGIMGGLAIALSSFLSPTLAQPISEDPSRITEDAPPSQCAPRNQTRKGEVIVLGRIPDAPYRVVVPLRGDGTLLAEVRRCVADAFETTSPLGQYIQAGAFPTRSEARQLLRQLRRLDLDAQIFYGNL
ncbi:MAG: hypothetical protein MUF49_07295 [Oculatellaceae cyanobacterium Prado106]|jgi:hypothetical protein|nr:hypothetical protein [Oculatellaceae cyanobacterium Prado106]